MKISINRTEINYIDYGNSDKKAMVFLHGWGQNIEMMKMVSNPFKNDFRLIVLDLPGFGESEEPKYGWTNDDYVDMLEKFLKKIKAVEPILVGHSFGGKIALLYASKYIVNKLILFAPSYAVEKRKLTLIQKAFKKLKKIKCLDTLANKMKNKTGASDYRKASPIMKEVLVNSVNNDISENVKNIKCPTLLIWGTEDTAVPYNRAVELEKLIKNAGLVTYEGCTHYAYLERLNQTINVMVNFCCRKEE